MEAQSWFLGTIVSKGEGASLPIADFQVPFPGSSYHGTVEAHAA
jgi:hypothetical protein